MKKTIYLECDCKFHKIKINKFSLTCFKGIFLDISIYEHKSQNTDKLLKKPKLLADVVLSPEKLVELKKYFNE